MQKQELSFVIQGQEGKHYKDLIKFPTGLRQRNYTQAYDKAQSTLKAIKESTDLKYRLVAKYTPLYVPNTYSQLQFL